MRHPVYISSRSEKDEQEVQKQIDRNEEQLSQIAQGKPLGYHGMFNAVFAPEGSKPVVRISRTVPMPLLEYYERGPASRTAAAVGVESRARAFRKAYRSD